MISTAASTEDFRAGISRRALVQHRALGADPKNIPELASHVHQHASGNVWPQRLDFARALADQQNVMAQDIRFLAETMDADGAGRLRVAADQTEAKAQSFLSGLDDDSEADAHRVTER